MVLERRDIERAVKILEATEVKMPLTFAGVGKYSHADTLTKVMNEIAMRGDKGISQEELVYLFRNDANWFIMKEIIESLNLSGFLDTVHKSGKETYVRKVKGDEQANM
jgi:hypothetical protein